MIVVTFTSDNEARVSFEADDRERLREAQQKLGLTREELIKVSINERLDSVLVSEDTEGKT